MEVEEQAALPSTIKMRNENYRTMHERKIMISGLQKLTLLDYPGKVACTVFLQGCNYRCPFCHNTDLLPFGGEPYMTREEFLSFLKGKQGLLDAVCITGGEPTLTPELPQLLQEIKALGFLTKLDTNGTNPRMLRQLVEAGLVDYVAMDVKNSPQKYAETVGLDKLELSNTEQSLRYLMEDRVSYELRTTLVCPLHEGQDLEEMGQWLASLVPGKKPAVLYLQSFVDRDAVAFSGLSAPLEAELEAYVEILSPYVEKVLIRSK